MKMECVAQIESEIGRKLRKSEIDGIEDKLSYFLNKVNRDPENLSLTESKKMLAAAKLAMEDALFDANKKAQRSASNVLKKVQNEKNLHEEAARIGGKQPYYDAIFNLLKNVDMLINGARKNMLNQIADAIIAVEPKFFGLFENKQATHDLIFEAYGRDTGNQTAKSGSKALADTFEKIRIRANDAGADIGKLDGPYLPQGYDQLTVSKVGKSEFVNDAVQNADRTYYLNDDGSVMNDVQLKNFIEAAYETITTGGLNKMDVNVRQGVGGKAGKFDDAHRVLHFDGPEGYINMMEKYGTGTLQDVIQNHISGMAKDIALMETFGANPNSTFEHLNNIAMKENGIRSSFFMGNGRRMGVTTDMVWNTLTGKINEPVNLRLANVSQAVRNYMVGVKLGSAFISSLNDVGGLTTLYQYHGIPMGKSFVDVIKSMGGDAKQTARELGLYIDDLTSGANRWHTEHMTSNGWTARLANTTMKMSGLEGWTHLIRRAAAMGYTNHLTNILKKYDFNSLDGHKAGYQGYFKNRGVTKEIWDVWQRAETKNVDGVDFLTSEAIMKMDIDPDLKNKAADTFMGLVAREAETASINPDLMTRALVGNTGQKGTVYGEAGRAFWLFKSFPLSIIARHMERVKEIPSIGGKMQYSASLIIPLTLLGGMSLQLKDMVNGKDPREMDEKFWVAAFIQGGGVGIFGDILYTGFGGDSRGGQANWTGILGPVFGTAFDAADMSLGNAGKAAAGKKTNFAASSIRLARQNAPFVGLWYAKGAVDHVLTYELQEAVNPGFKRRMQSRAKKEYGQDYWWSPDSTLPDRLPSFGEN